MTTSPIILVCEHTRAVLGWTVRPKSQLGPLRGDPPFASWKTRGKLGGAWGPDSCFRHGFCGTFYSNEDASLTDGRSAGSLVRVPRDLSDIRQPGACSSIFKRRRTRWHRIASRIPSSTQWPPTLNPKFVSLGPPPRCTTDGSCRNKLEWMPPFLTPAVCPTRMAHLKITTRLKITAHPTQRTASTAALDSEFVPLVSLPRCITDVSCRCRVGWGPPTTALEA